MKNQKIVEKAPRYARASKNYKQFAGSRPSPRMSRLQTIKK